ncbi:MAG TPA: metallophosphoesterase, partial [Rhodothermales bacterium]|nr:metallophosphoesterase [Rhodothermales bacterium]
MLFVVLLFSACSTTRDLLQVIASEGEQPSDTTRAYTIYLIGDVGEARPMEPSLQLLKRKLDEEGPNSAVVFLGDNIYPSGMPPPNNAYRPEAERRINEQIEVTQDFEGQVVFVPGNHDWGGRGIGGSRTTLRRQELYVENALDRGNTFLPDR